MARKEPKDFIYNGSSYPGITTTKTKKGNRYSAVIGGVIPLTSDMEEPLYGSRKMNDVKITKISENPWGYQYRVSGKKRKNVKNYLISNDFMND